MDKEHYELHGDSTDVDQYRNDINIVAALVHDCWTQIERVATHLRRLYDPKEMKRDEVVRYMNMTVSPIFSA